MIAMKTKLTLIVGMDINSPIEVRTMPHQPPAHTGTVGHQSAQNSPCISDLL